MPCGARRDDSGRGVVERDRPYLLALAVAGFGVSRPGALVASDRRKAEHDDRPIADMGGSVVGGTGLLMFWAASRQQRRLQ